MLDTGVKPYTDVADLFIIDPDGYIIRYLHSELGKVKLKINFVKAYSIKFF